MSLDLNLRFPSPDRLVVSLEGKKSGELPFVPPLTRQDRKEIQWYLETYAAQYTTDVDDAEAARIEAKLPLWGNALFDAAFSDETARCLFDRFHESKKESRLLTISAEHPTVLSLPWELLRDPKTGFLFDEQPHNIAIRRCAPSVTGRQSSFEPTKPRLHMLFVISRPSDVSFIDPRADVRAVMNAVEQHAPGRVEFEFLRPATFRNLVERLEEKNLPHVDVIHFDGHGAFDTEGTFGEKTPNTGYLLFERQTRLTQFVSSRDLSNALIDHGVMIAVLSACQSAAIGESDAGPAAKEPIGSVAYGLILSGIPAVLAMTHSVLVATTGKLFGQLYQNLANGQSIGEALDNARDYLKRHPEKHEIQRGAERIMLKLQDWFLPALYQGARNVRLLDGAADVTRQVARAPVQPDNLPELERAGFFGRSRELWEIERWFIDGARRVSITGFGGQGKTSLAVETGRWLLRTGIFERVAFVDYAAFQGVDPVGLAVATLGTILQESFPNADAAAVALRRTPTLVILDNLEALQKSGGGEAPSAGSKIEGAPAPLHDLLGVAKIWSECGDSRVLITSRTPDFDHPDYRFEGSKIHRALPLKGLGPEDALSFFQSLMKLPPAPTVHRLPEREALLQLFGLVDFHPLSIGLLAQQLKTRSPADLGKRLEALVAESGGDQNKSLVASLELSLDRLDAQARQWLPRLGIFQGGTSEPNLVEIARIPAEHWPVMREQLESAALIRVESFSELGMGLLYLKFHPTLAPMLWSHLPPDEKDKLSAAHRQRYFELSGWLYSSDRTHPDQVRAIVRLELPNLLRAVYAALDAGDKTAGEFAMKVCHFLKLLGLNRDYAALIERATATPGAPGSQSWYLALSERGEQLLAAGRVAEAADVFQQVLDGLGDTPGYSRCHTLNLLGQCFADQGHPELAARSYNEALEVAKALAPSAEVKQLCSVVLSNFGDALRDLGEYQKARMAYEASLAMATEIGDSRQTGVVHAQLGNLARLQGNLSEAEQRGLEALNVFQRLNEQPMEASIRHQLGLMFQKAGKWDEAEKHYREAARIKEDLGMIGGSNGAKAIWSQLGVVCEHAGKPEATEGWFRKDLQAYRTSGDRSGLATILYNLANLVQNDAERLAEARGLAEEALSIGKTLDPGAAEIWWKYRLLGDISAKQNGSDYARECHALARETRRKFPGTRLELKKNAQFIGRVVAVVVFQPERRQELEAALPQLVGRANLVAAIRQVLAGERDEEGLCAPLTLEESMIVDAILSGIDDPDSIKDLINDNSSDRD